MAAAAVSFLPEKVNQLRLQHKTKYIMYVGELEKLNNDLGFLKVFLETAASKEEGELEDLKLIIRDAIWVAEDTIEGACLHQGVAARTGIFSGLGYRFKPPILSSLFNKWRADRNLPVIVKSLREDVVRPVLDRVNAYRSTAFAYRVVDAIRKEERRSTGEEAYIGKDHFVGFKDVEDTILASFLKKNDEGLDVISIAGMSGLGKTTLAWKIYQNEDIVYTFPIRMWIRASQTFTMRAMMLSIMQSFFTSQDISGMSDDELIQTVSAILKEERFFLVLDDVQSLNFREKIQKILPEGNGKGKVLITTSDKKADIFSYKNMKSHELQLLDEEESWKLLQLQAFGKLGACPQELETIGRSIASNCDGHPQKIAVLGGILVDKQKWLWEKVLSHAKLFSHCETSISDAVELAYNMLPDELRVCFLYMGMFPEDYEIPVWKLTRLWIAEGFVQPGDKLRLEESAYQNLDDLINRNLVMAGKLNANGEVKTCRVHGLIGDFCRSKGEQQNLFQVAKAHKGISVPPVSEPERLRRRLCVHSKANMFPSDHVQNSLRVHSLLCFHEPLYSTFFERSKYVSTIPDIFDHLLKVLEWESNKLDQMPQNISRMSHLRYVTLSIDGLRAIPRTLSALWNLQTLAVETKSRIIKMKANILKMIGLRHIKTNAAIVLSSKDDGPGGENIQTLDSLSAKSCTESLLARTPNLKALGVRGKLETLFKNVSLGEASRLVKVKLVDILTIETTSSNLRNLPPPNFFPQKLRWLTLSKTFFQWEHMLTLARIDTLEVLKLKDNAFVGIYWKVEDGHFPNLKFLHISNTNLVLWEPSSSSFPRLSCLEVKNCEYLKEIPDALSKTLVKLDIDRLRGSAVDSAMRIADKRRKKSRGVPFKLQIGPKCERK